VDATQCETSAGADGRAEPRPASHLVHDGVFIRRSRTAASATRRPTSPGGIRT
jgi:hypothetical protein